MLPDTTPARPTRLRRAPWPHAPRDTPAWPARLRRVPRPYTPRDTPARSARLRRAPQPCAPRDTPTRPARLRNPRAFGPEPKPRRPRGHGIKLFPITTAVVRLLRRARRSLLELWGLSRRSRRRSRLPRHAGHHPRRSSRPRRHAPFLPGALREPPLRTHLYGWESESASRPPVPRRSPRISSSPWALPNLTTSPASMSPTSLSAPMASSTSTN
uniref:Uncharacterized protein n=1 Tax=Musa acuminata subsp. malaccensis TaxID=214687 RepID=A0A804KUD5_MUSAM